MKFRVILLLLLVSLTFIAGCESGEATKARPTMVIVMSTDVVAESEPELETESQVEHESVAETESETELVVQTEAHSEPESEPESETEKAPETERQSHHGGGGGGSSERPSYSTDTDDEDETETTVKTETAPDIETDAYTETEPETEPETESEELPVDPCANGHIFGDWEAVENTDIHKRICTVTNCNANETEEHEYDAPIIVDGEFHVIACSICEIELEEEHDFKTSQILFPSSCNVNGREEQECDCGAKREVDSPLLVHEDGIWEILDDLSHHKFCDACGEEIAVAPHVFGDGETVMQKSCYSEGLVRYACTLCDKQKEESIPASHNIVDGACTDCPYVE